MSDICDDLALEDRPLKVKAPLLNDLKEGPLAEATSSNKETLLPYQEQDFFSFIEPSTPASQSVDFICSEANDAAYQMIMRWPEWDGHHALFLSGPPHCGKTALASIWRDRSDARFLSRQEICHTSWGEGNNAHGAFIVDGIESIYDENSLFHLFNAVKEAGGSLLLTAHAHPHNCGIRLPDLTSRLQAIPLATMGQPDDELLRTLFVKQFSDRQLDVGMDVIDYILARIERSFGAVVKAVEALDRASWKSQKRITVPLARSVMKNL